MSDLLFVINPGAGTVARSGSMLGRLKRGPIPIIEPDFDWLDEQMRPYLPYIRAVAVEGGDGTVRAVVAALLRLCGDDQPLPEVLIVSGGTTNLIASALGTPRSKRMLEKLLEGRGELVHMPALLIADQDEAPKRTGFFLASGSIARGTTYCREIIHSKGVRGMTSVLLSVASAVLGNEDHRSSLLAATAFEARTEDTEIAPRHRFAIVSTLPRLTKRFAPFWGKGSEPINLLVAAEQNRRLARALIRCVFGFADPRLEEDGYISRRTSKVAVTHDGPYVLDGESFTSGAITVTASRPIPFRVPA
jgi:hypothetical protein